MDLKVGILGTIFSLAVGGGLYGLYLNYASRAALTELTAYELLQQCGALEARFNPQVKEIKEWLAAAKARRPEIFAVNAIVGSAASRNDTGTKVAADVDVAFGLCTRSLQKKLAELEPVAAER
ncbi:hypothetical protein GGR70_004091 [Xanthomonas campestris]|uniref:hypothetical protein n=1 Tax=Xanthomonas campestris TaxID=339 RepID=UPI00216A999B|nr:hypothetical protein [Xanthomonas campestris]MCS3849003.1 hypothetical protein [Xanthomonas campestris]